MSLEQQLELLLRATRDFQSKATKYKANEFEEDYAHHLKKVLSKSRSKFAANIRKTINASRLQQKPSKSKNRVVDDESFDDDERVYEDSVLEDMNEAELASYGLTNIYPTIITGPKCHPSRNDAKHSKIKKQHDASPLSYDSYDYERTRPPVSRPKRTIHKAKYEDEPITQLHSAGLSDTAQEAKLKAIFKTLKPLEKEHAQSRLLRRNKKKLDDDDYDEDNIENVFRKILFQDKVNKKIEVYQKTLDVYKMIQAALESEGQEV